MIIFLIDQMNINILKLLRLCLCPLLIYYILAHTYSLNICQKILSFFRFNSNLFFSIQIHSFSLLIYCFYFHLQCFDGHLSCFHFPKSLTFLLWYYFLTLQPNSCSLSRNFLTSIIYFMILTRYLSFHSLNFYPL